MTHVLIQSTDLVSMVYSCIGAEIDDSDSSSTCDIKDLEHGADGSNATSAAPPDTPSNGHVVSPKQQTDRQMETGRQERIVPLTDSRMETADDAQSSSVGGGGPCGPRPEPPLQNTKPSLAVMRQRPPQDSLGTAMVTGPGQSRSSTVTVSIQTDSSWRG